MGPRGSVKLIIKSFDIIHLLLKESNNALKTQQDHSCVIETIRRKFLYTPGNRAILHNMTLQLDNSDDLSTDQSTAVLRLLRNQVA